MPRNIILILYWEIFIFKYRVVNKIQGPGISPSSYECGPQLLLFENRRKI